MASVAKFKLNEAPRLLAHCSRSQKSHGEHIHADRTQMNFNMANGRHEGVDDYAFAKQRIHDDNVHMLKRDDVKAVCSWAITMPRSLCHEEVGFDGEEFYEANDPQQCREFFQYAYDFFKQKHGEENIISANVHMDENVPHMHFTFVPIVKDKTRGGYKVSAKEALDGCYGAKFQIELQDYISAKMGIPLDMVRKDTVDYERNVKELKKKTLNERCAYLSKEIARTEEQLKRRQQILGIADAAEQAGQRIDDIRVSSSNGFTVMRDSDWKYIQPFVKAISTMRAERDELKKALAEFEQSNLTEENQSLQEQAEQLAKENEKLEQELQHVKRFMEQTKVKDVPLSKLYEQQRRKEQQRYSEQERRQRAFSQPMQKGR